MPEGGLRINRSQLQQVFGDDFEALRQFEVLMEQINDWSDIGFPASGVTVDVTNFADILSGTDTNVQLALDTLDDHNHDGRYYTEAEINAFLALYYTKIQLDAGQLDNRYYTETEVDSKIHFDRTGTIIAPKVAGDSVEIDGSLRLTEVVFVSAPSQLPAAVAGVITLLADTTYYFTTSIDLTGDRLVGAANTCLLGASSENATITSTGLGVSVALFTTDYTTPIRHISISDVGTAIDIDGSRSGTAVALDWTGVNFSNVPTIGTIKDVDNWIYSKGAFLNSQGLIFDGSIGTVGVDNSIFSGDGSAGSIMSLLATATITRRFRIIYSSIIAFTSTVGLDISTSATVPSEGYILDTINFAGGGTYTTGVPYTDDKARFVGVRGVSNSAEIGAYYMIANATVTTITTISTPVKILGTTTLNTTSQKFTHTSNRATYVGALTRIFKVSAIASFTSGNNINISLFIAKNGVVDPASEMQATTDGVGRSESIAVQTIAELATGDYFEVWIENNSGTNNITVEYLSLIALGVAA